MPIVAIVSEPYCGAEEIAAQVADRLGCTLVDRQLADLVSRAFGLSPDQVRRALSGERTWLDRVTRQTARAVRLTQAAVARMLPRHGVVLHSLASQLIPREITHVLRVGILGERSFRVGAAVEAEGCAEATAARLIEGCDGRCDAWAREVLGRRLWEPTHFDLMISRPALGAAQAVDRILESTARDTHRPTDRSLQAERDFLISAEVTVALLERGSLLADVSADQGRVIVRLQTRRSPKGALARMVHALSLESRLEQARAICRAVPGVQRVEVIPTAPRAGAPLPDDGSTSGQRAPERRRLAEPGPERGPGGLQAIDAG